ncbi:MAG: hypothetical protein WCR72_17995, partial [Bacteroidota bacterium]
AFIGGFFIFCFDIGGEIGKPHLSSAFPYLVRFSAIIFFTHCEKHAKAECADSNPGTFLTIDF